MGRDTHGKLNELPRLFPIQRSCSKRPAFVSDLDGRVLLGPELSEPPETSGCLGIGRISLGIVVRSNLMIGSDGNSRTVGEKHTCNCSTRSLEQSGSHLSAFLLTHSPLLEPSGQPSN
jgi:hypothetical protein